jgi:hypothetical protein
MFEDFYWPEMYDDFEEDRFPETFEEPEFLRDEDDFDSDAAATQDYYDEEDWF